MESKKELEHQLKERWPVNLQLLYSKLSTEHVWLVKRRLVNEMSFKKLSQVYGQNELSIKMLVHWIIEKIKTEVDHEFGLFLENYHKIISRLEKKKGKSKD